LIAAHLRHTEDEEDFEKIEPADAIEIGDDHDENGSDADEVEEGGGRDDISNKAGIILGIHNVFVVIPQFLVTGLSSILFAIFEPDKSVIHHGSAHAIGNSTSTVVHDTAISLIREAGDDNGQRFDSIGFIFRIGGVSAGIACVICWRLARELK